jgi:hypothetical protein
MVRKGQRRKGAATSPTLFRIQGDDGRLCAEVVQVSHVLSSISECDDALLAHVGSTNAARRPADHRTGGLSFTLFSPRHDGRQASKASHGNV